jgi:putative glutamine amidotransferase
MEKPIIGVIPLWDEKKDSIWMLPGYMQGLEEAGAVPMILNLTVSETSLKPIINFFDGFLFTGGHDVNPKLYGQEKTDYCGEICETRDQMEAYIFHEAVLNQNKPALGICRGIQLFNVLLGGSLYQDIPAELLGKISHSQEQPYDVPAHNVRLLPESPLRKLAGKENIEVNSYHHQGINKLAKGLEVMALADDGLIEAVYMPDRSYVWAVQWHPEFYLNDEVSKKIFSSFVGSIEKSLFPLKHKGEGS